jgi:Putative metallopeptidase
MINLIGTNCLCKWAAGLAILCELSVYGQSSARAQEAATEHVCDVDLTQPGKMSDVLSNALVRGFKVNPDEARLFLEGAPDRHSSGQELLQEAAGQFRIEEVALAAKVEKYRHCNCKHPVQSDLHPLLQDDPNSHSGCEVNLELAGSMSDILSNALMRSFQIPEREVRGFLNGADERFEDGAEVFNATASHFRLTEDELAAEIQNWKHVNCQEIAAASAETDEGSEETADIGISLTPFARDVTLHVVLHEMGHGLIREFDLPILGNEETMADAFATHYLVTQMPDRAVDVLKARVSSLMIEARQSPEQDWTGEHDHDGRRAFQIAALAVAADRRKYQPVAEVAGMSTEDIDNACDYGSEIHRSWRRVLDPLWMPESVLSSEARVDFGSDNPLISQLQEDGVAGEIETALRRFDWHSQVKVAFVPGDGGASWSRSSRTITVHTGYVRRFINQGSN